MSPKKVVVGRPLFVDVVADFNQNFKNQHKAK